MTLSPAHVIVGLGQTGISAAHYLARAGYTFAINDTRENPPGLEQIKAIYPQAELHLGGLNAELLANAQQIIVSPGVSIREPAIAAARAKGIEIIGDVECFLREITAPVIAITGTNGKSTVTSLVGDMAKQAGIHVQVGGNIGTPVLDLIAEPLADLYVLELSSFQLETTYSLQATAATILNISDDHMDRYDDLNDYTAAKQRIYHHAKQCVFNRNDALTRPDAEQNAVSFALDEPAAGQFGIRAQQFYYGDYALMPVKDMRLQGQQNQMNALAALALAQAAKIPLEACLGEIAGVQYYNDSKGTNVGATIAAVDGLAATISGKIILLAGGQGKGADFSPLRNSLEQHVRHCLLFGEDARTIEKQLDGATSFTQVLDLNAAVEQAKMLAQSGDLVLLSPACASFDMFRNYAHRGDVFAELVAKIGIA